jgi:hypothetical protein
MKRRQQLTMSTNTQFQQILDLMARTKAALDKIAAGGGLTSEQADTVIAGMTVIAVQAESIAGVTPPTTTITTITPNPVAKGANATVTGTGFGATQGKGIVAFNGAPSTIVSWSDTSIVATVPATATTGPVTVITDSGNNVVFPSLTIQ